MTELVTIDRLGRDGDGLAERADGGRLAVPGALPGERVLVDASADPAELVRIEDASPERVAPPCLHAAACGGCRMQHASTALLADWRLGQVREALARRGIAAPIRPVISAPPGSRRRVGFTATRTKKGVLLGFNGARSHTVIDAPQCRIARPEIMAALPDLRALAMLAAPRKRAIGLHVTLSLEGLDIALRDAKALDAALLAEVTDWSARSASAIARITWNGEPALQLAPPLQRFGLAEVAPPPGGFLQATEEGEQAMAVLAEAALSGAGRVADLFCGCGTFALVLAKQAEVLAIDGDKAAIAALDRGWRQAPGLRKIAATARDLFRRPLLAAEMKGLDAILFDPPRAGAEAQAREIAQSSVERVVGVSCNPASFARDAEILIAGGFRLTAVTPIDQFLWSPHIELVGVFKR